MGKRRTDHIDAQTRTRFEIGCLLAGTVLFVTNLIDIRSDLVKIFQRQHGINDQIQVLLGGLTAALLFTAIPLVLAFLISRKGSRLALILLITYDICQFLEFLGSAQDHGMFAYRPLESLIPGIIIAICLLSLRNSKSQVRT